MIDIKKLTEKDVGRGIVFCNPGYTRTKGQKGIIIDWDLSTYLINVKYEYPNVFGNYDVNNHNNGILETIPKYLKFDKPPKPIEIVTRADLMDLDND